MVIAKGFIMKKHVRIVVVFLLMICEFGLFSRDYYQSDKIKFGDYIYKESIKSVTLSLPFDVLTLPVITLNTDEQLLLQFDELADDYRSFRFTFIHCDAAWKPTEDLLQYEFLEGLFEDDIYEHKFSFNTIQDYIHYTKLFPSEKMRPKLSGNYLLVVYEDGYQDDPFLTMRFMVLEQRVSIVEADVIQDQRPSTHLEMQRVQFGVSTTGYNISFPDRDLKVVLRQNERWDNIKFLKPLNIRGDTFGYDFYNDENVFNGLNEYRYFDIKTLKSNTINVGRIRQDNQGMYYVGLLTDIPRPRDIYKVSSDLNGKFFLKTDDYEDENTQSEYAWVYFFLKTDVPVSNGSVYLIGNFLQNRIDESSLMKYNYDRKGYETTLYLKQGYYEYMYAYVDDYESRKADLAYFEGNHWETSNDYYIYVYHKETGDKHDRLIAFQKLSFR
jgi:hypothetical protein